MNYSDVSRALEAVVRANGGSAYIGEVSTRTRPALQGLAFIAGVVYADRLNDANLLRLYMVARKELSSLPQFVAILDANMGNPYTSPAAKPSKVKPYFPPIEEPKAPEPAVFALSVPEVVEKVLGEIRGDLDTLADNLQSGMDTIKEASLKEASAKAIAVATETAHRILKEALPTTLHVTFTDAPKVELGTVHFQTPKIIKALMRGDHVYLHGPAGSGKTTCAAKVAQAFGLKLYTVAKVESEYLLLGFRDARGDAVRTPFREAYEHGGLFLFDELDGSSPGAIVALNMALANGICPFPDATIAMHKDFKCIAAGNTALRGADRQYNGRSQLDAASIDRFAFINFPYDDALESAIAPHRGWLDFIRTLRARVEERGLPHLITPRATIAGGRALLDGETWQDAAESYVWKGLDPDTIEAIYKSVPSEVFELLEPQPEPDPFRGLELITV